MLWGWYSGDMDPHCAGLIGRHLADLRDKKALIAVSTTFKKGVEEDFVCRAHLDGTVLSAGELAVIVFSLTLAPADMTPNTVRLRTLIEYEPFRAQLATYRDMILMGITVTESLAAMLPPFAYRG
jgi:hypothetical protein